MVSSEQILEVVGTPRWTRMMTGKLDALERFSAGPSWEAKARRQLLSDLRQLPAAERTAVYVHPAEAAGMGSYRRDSGATELTPAELVWLQRLPLEPERISHDDATRLAGMAATIDRQASPSSYQLAQSVWGPVKELHDRQQAQAELEALRQTPLPSMPASVVDALREALVEEHPDWPPAGVQEHASELIAQRLNDRERQRAAMERELEERLSALDLAAVDRGALVR